MRSMLFSQLLSFVHPMSVVDYRSKNRQIISQQKKHQQQYSTNRTEQKRCIWEWTWRSGGGRNRVVTFWHKNSFLSSFPHLDQSAFHIVWWFGIVNVFFIRSLSLCLSACLTRAETKSDNPWNHDELSAKRERTRAEVMRKYLALVFKILK